MIKHRTAIAIGIALFLVLACTGVSNALWNTQASMSASVTAGSLGITLAGTDSLQVVYSTNGQAVTGALAVTNTGSLPAPYSLTLGVDSANTLAQAIDVSTWVKNGTCAVTPPGLATKWTSLPTLTGSLQPQQTVTYCVLTALPTINGTSVGAMTASVHLSSALGTNWNSVADAVVTQSAVDTEKPTAPTALTASAPTSTTATLTWTASTDNVLVTGYDIFRTGQTNPVATVTSTSYIVTGLTATTAYSYYVKAKDAAGNASNSSTTATVTTPAPTLFTLASGGTCLSTGGAPAGANLIAVPCSGSTEQQWQFTSAGQMRSQSSVLYAGNPGNSGLNKPILLATAANAGAWTAQALLTPYLGSFQITNGFDRCLDATSTNVVQNKCSAGTPGQRFTLTAVN